MTPSAARTALLTLAAASLLAGCGAGPGGGLETRTFRLEHMDPEVAGQLIQPYILSEGSGLWGVEGSAGALTIRERPEVLERIAATLAEYDRPQPTIRLRFQLIEADGFEGADPAIAEVEAALRELFRFDGYRLLAETVVSRAQLRSSFAQFVTVADERYTISGFVSDLQRSDVQSTGGGSAADEPATVLLDINLGNVSREERVLNAQVRIPAGQTVVIGNGQTSGREGTLILTVRPELQW